MGARHSPSRIGRGPRAFTGIAMVLVLAGTAASCGSDTGGAAERRRARDDRPARATSGPLHRFVAIDAGGLLTKDALAEGDIDVAVLFTSSAGEAAHGWVHLIDDRGLQPAENFVPAVNGSSLGDDVAAVLDLVSSALTEEAVQRLMDELLVSEGTVERVAEGFVTGLGTMPPVSGELTVGRATFPESGLVGEIYAAALEAGGATVRRTPELGFREVYFPTLENGEVDVMPEFVGSLLAYLGGTPTSDLASTLADVRDRARQRGVAILEPAPAESKDGFYVTPETARRHELVSVSDLARVEVPLVFGGPAECPEREFCLIGLQDVYGLRFES